MEEAVYKVIEITGSSKTGLEAAIQNAISRTGRTIKNMRWFEVVSTRGYIESNAVSYWQVTIKVGFRIDEKIQEEAHIKSSSSVESRKMNFDKYRCLVCGYIYDPAQGDSTAGIKPGTRFADLPDDWKCPECGVGKDQFERI